MKNNKSYSEKISESQLALNHKFSICRLKYFAKTASFQCCILIALICSTSILSAQNSYRFETLNATYTDIDSSTTIPWGAFNPNYNTYNILAPLTGETINFYNIPFTFGGIKTFAVQPNASLRIDNDSSLIIIDAAFAGMDSIDVSSSISYSITGMPGNYILKSQWKNLKINVGQANNFVNLQTWVYQQSGIVELHYGPSSANNASGYNTTYGPQVGMFYSRDDFTLCYEKLWVTGSPFNIALDSNANYSFLAMSGVPSNGTVYRFIPRQSPTSINTTSPELNNISLFPNPTSDILTFHTSSLNPFQIEIYTSTGNKVLQKRISNNQTISVGHLAAGVYFAKIISKHYDSVIKKIELIR